MTDEQFRPRLPQRYWLHGLLFLLTFGSTMLAGSQWAGLSPDQYSEITNWGAGLTYAILIMLFLTAHEFGHYIAARIHKVDATLPFYIPMPLILFGTMGAVIKTRSVIPNRKVLFDIGVAGPISGFIVCLGILAVGYATLPPMEWIYTIHPEYQRMAEIPTSGMYFGDMLLFGWMADIFAPAGSFIPPMNEVYHYPFLCVGWFGLFVTALNLAPFGNLDGGHVVYALLGGKKQRFIARTLWWPLFTLGVLSMVGILDGILREPSPNGFVIWLQTFIGASLSAVVDALPWLFTIGEGWLLWALLIKFFIKIDHPELGDPEPLSIRRKIVGWTSMLILVLCMPVQLVYFVP